jgi:hypothetical protein
MYEHVRNIFVWNEFRREVTFFSSSGVVAPTTDGICFVLNVS